MLKFIVTVDMQQDHLMPFASDHFRDRLWNVVQALCVILGDPSLGSVFCYVDDYVKLGLCCRTLYVNATEMGLYAHLHLEWSMWQEEHLIEIYTESVGIVCFDMTSLCFSCGIRAAEDFLGGIECIECYHAH